MCCPSQVKDQIAASNGGSCGNRPRPSGRSDGGANRRSQQRMESQEFFLQSESDVGLSSGDRTREPLQHARSTASTRAVSRRSSST